MTEVTLHRTSRVFLFFFFFKDWKEKPKRRFLAKENRPCSVPLFPHILYFYTSFTSTLYINLLLHFQTSLARDLKKKKKLKEQENHRAENQKTPLGVHSFLSDGSFGNWMKTGCPPLCTAELLQPMLTPCIHLCHPYYGYVIFLVAQCYQTRGI